jgi:hypothetical protein
MEYEFIEICLEEGTVGPGGVHHHTGRRQSTESGGEAAWQRSQNKKRAVKKVIAMP